MTRRKRILRAVGLLVAIGGAVNLAWIALPGPGISIDNARRIRGGMTLEEVELVLGTPGQLRQPVDPNDYRFFFWKNGSLLLIVAFDGDENHPWNAIDTPLVCTNGAWVPLPPTSWERRRRWLGL